MFSMRRDWPRRRPRWISAAIVFALLILGRLWQDGTLAPPAHHHPDGQPSQERHSDPGEKRSELAAGPYRVERVVDGDTLLLANRARIRLLGVDTPETVKPDSPVEPFGPEATAFTRDFVGQRQVRLEFDRERLDDHGRYLAYVWVGERMLNEELLRAGLGRALLRHPYSERWKRVFRQAQDEARALRRGLWADDDHR